MGRRLVRAADGSVLSEEQLEQLRDPLRKPRMPWTRHMFHSIRYGIPGETDNSFSRKRETWLTFILMYMLHNPRQNINDYYDHLQEEIFRFLRRLDLNAYSFGDLLDWCTSYIDRNLMHYRERDRKQIIKNIKAMLIKGHERLVIRNYLNSINITLLQ